MDKYGFIALLVGAVIFLLGKNDKWRWAHALGLFVMGTGLGILIGAIGSYLIITSMFP